MISQQNSYIETFNKINFEQIVDHPNILIAARFWDDDRYNAAKTCYKLMRSIDDLIDNHKATHHKIAETDKNQFENNVNHWIGNILHATKDTPWQTELSETFDRFKIPFWPMEAFAKSMIYDIHNDGFPSLKTFLEYAEGASIAPASIFVHLCGISKQNEEYTRPSYDVKAAASPCAIFSYLVHIIRDFQKDQLNNLNYFADDLIVKHGLTRNELNQMAHGMPVNSNFYSLIQEYYVVADEYRKKTYDAIRYIRPYLGEAYQLSLDIIFNLYLMVFERIDLKKGKFTTEELNPTPEEIRQRVYKAIMDFQAT